MPLVYIAGPYRAPARFVGHIARACAVDANIAAAGYFGRLVAEAGGAPLVPHAVGHLADGYGQPLPDEFWLKATMTMLAHCDALLLIPGWRDSIGSTAEREAALSVGMPILDLDGEDRQYRSVVAEWIRSLEAAP